ncbi:MAG: hypothetical protein Q9201_000933 [Fulgogasparrea decipioides]
MTSPPSCDALPPPLFREAQPFRFKRKHPDNSAANPGPSKRLSQPTSSFHHPNHRRHHSPHHHRSRQHRSPSLSSDQHLDSETAFRESLFDALADDEGAAFWESVYGQPIHTYSPYILSSAKTNNDPEQAELQRMTDDEYATYVRARMWEKSHGFIIEERRRREVERVRRKHREKHERDWERSVEEALKRGEERREKSRWKDAWGRYLRGWDVLSQIGNREDTEMKERIPWPVETVRYKDVAAEQVEKFFKHAPQPRKPGDEVNLGATLKVERLRWHPDKFLQRAGGQGLDKETIAKVTTVFQVIDRMWSGMRHA